MKKYTTDSQSPEHDNEFLNMTKWVDIILAFVEWGCFTFLAITTAIMVYGTMQGVTVGMSPQRQTLVVSAAIVMMYLIIDFGLKDKFKAYLYLRHNQTPETKANKYRRLFMSMILIMIVARGIATMTSSVWAAPEIAEITVGQNQAAAYVEKMMTTDSLKADRENKAIEQAQLMISSEAQRLKRAKVEAATLLNAAIKSGNRWQQDSYRREGLGWIGNKNAGASNHAYAKRIKQAKADGDALIAKVMETTALASQNVQAVANDSTYSHNSATLSALAMSANDNWQNKTARRNNFIIFLDILAFVFGFLICYLRVIRNISAGKKPATRNLTTILGKKTEQSMNSWLDFLEDLLGVDINRDGKIGTKQTSETSRNQAVAASIQTGVSGDVYTIESTPPPAQKQAENNGLKQLETVVKQVFQQNETDRRNNEERIAKQAAETTPKQDELLIINTDEKYLRQKCKQAYLRMKTQEDPTTPRKNFEQLSRQLIALGYEIITNEQPAIWFEKEGRVYGK